MTDKKKGALANMGRQSLADQAYKRLEELIVMLEIPPGEVLSELSLVQQLGIGRTPIREALQRLNHEGLVSILPRRGVLVSEINVQRQLELLRVRREIERLMVRLAAVRSTQQERKEYIAIAEGMTKSVEKDDVLTFMRLDRRLNVMVAHGCRNEFARKTMRLMHGLSRRFWYIHYRGAQDLPLGSRLHVDYARAIAEGDPQKAADACDRLIDYLDGFAREMLDAGEFEHTSENARAD